MMKNKKAYIFNIILFAFGLAGLVISFFGMTVGEIFSYYTQDSNIFSMIVSGLYLFYPKKEPPEYIKILRYSATSCLMVTFSIVILVLGPMYGIISYPWLFFHGANFFYHVSCPVLAFISFVFFESGKKPSLKASFLAVIPTAVYAAALVILNALKVVYGPYPFLHIYEQPLFMSVFWCIAILAVAWFMAFLIAKLKRAK